MAVALDPSEMLKALAVSEPMAFGPYRLLDRIAEGGMAAIYRGHHQRTGQVVALKTVRTAARFESEALEREVATLLELRHPGVIRLLGNGESGDLPWIAVELLHGHTLFEEICAMWRGLAPAGRRLSLTVDLSYAPSGDENDWTRELEVDPALMAAIHVAAGGRLRDVVSLIVRLAPILDYVHSRGVVHRDVKPENIFLGDDGRMTLLDFGTALRRRQSAREVEPARLCMATVEYSAPELLCGYQVDPRADLYSLGCILYELVSGHRVFEGTTPEEIARKHVDDEPRCPSSLVCGLSWRLEDLILSLLAKDPNDRPRSAGEVASRLLRVASYD